MKQENVWEKCRKSKRISNVIDTYPLEVKRLPKKRVEDGFHSSGTTGEYCAQHEASFHRDGLFGPFIDTVPCHTQAGRRQADGRVPVTAVVVFTCIYPVVGTFMLNVKPPPDYRLSDTAPTHTRSSWPSRVLPMPQKLFPPPGTD